MPDDLPPLPDPNDPLGLGKLFGADVLGQLQRMMSWSGGPVNWDLAAQVADAALSGADPAVNDDDRQAVAAAGRLAEVWLDPVTTLPGSGADPQAWSRETWLRETQAAWRELIEPVAARVTQALGGALQQGLSGEGGGLGEGLPPELRGMLAGLGPNPFAGVLEQVGGVVFGAQVGQALGALAQDVLSTTEVGLPLGRSALLPANVAAFAEGLDVPLDEVRLYLALREAAHQRLFTHVPWLRAHLHDAVDGYARGIDLDLAALEDAVGSLDLTDPAAAQDALASGLFATTPTPGQQAALDRLETLLALVEGWVDLVVDTAATGRLPHAAALRETVRRRRATGGPAEQTFATLVGLQLRPRRLREAATLWGRVTQVHGAEGRDALWAHPDLLPGAQDLDDPLAWGTEEPTTTDWDAGLRALDKDFDGTLDDDQRGNPDPDREKGSEKGPEAG